MEVLNRPGFPCAFSTCRNYRYALWRIWGDGKNPCLFIGLNPSTADETIDDPTIRRCVGFAKSFGNDSMIMVNLFAYRATDPKVMKLSADPVGPENDIWLEQLSAIASIKIAAWGSNGCYLNRDKYVSEKIIGLKCLGVTKGGNPRHPLYLASATPLQQFC